VIEGNFYKIFKTELSCVEYLKCKRPATVVLLVLVYAKVKYIDRRWRHISLPGRHIWLLYRKICKSTEGKQRTWPPGNEKWRAGDILMKFGTLGLFLTRNRTEIFSGPKNDPLVVKSRVRGQYGQIEGQRSIWSKIDYGRSTSMESFGLREFTYVKIT
jgi:hypothetical protein